MIHLIKAVSSSVLTSSTCPAAFSRPLMVWTQRADIAEHKISGKGKGEGKHFLHFGLLQWVVMARFSRKFGNFRGVGEGASDREATRPNRRNSPSPERPGQGISEKFLVKRFTWGNCGGDGGANSVGAGRGAAKRGGRPLGSPLRLPLES